MREALAARPDDDFVVASPRRSRSAASRGGRGARDTKPPGLAARAFAFAWRHPVEILISIGLATAASAIIWNALALQTARHPAPLFSPRPPWGDQAPLPPIRPSGYAEEPFSSSAPPVPFFQPAAPLAPMIVPPPRPGGRDPINELIRGGDPAQPSRPGPVPFAATPQRPAPTRDAIGDLIRLGETAPIPPGYVGRAEPTRLVASGQRALARLNYITSKADGILGPETRIAVERFEQDHRLPVTGEFNPRTARELAVHSGLPVE